MQSAIASIRECGRLNSRIDRASRENHWAREVPKHDPGPSGLLTKSAHREGAISGPAWVDQDVTVMVALPVAVTAVLPSLEETVMVTA
jgi:hypothetical protein